MLNEGVFLLKDCYSELKLVKNEDTPEKWQAGSRSIGRKLKGLGFVNTTRSSGSIRGFEIGCKVMLRLISEYDEKKMRIYTQEKCSICSKRSMCSIYKDLGLNIKRTLEKDNVQTFGKRSEKTNNKNNDLNITNIMNVSPECTQEEKEEVYEDVRV